MSPGTGFGTVLTGVSRVSKGVKLAESDRKELKPKVKPVGRDTALLARVPESVSHHPAIIHRFGKNEQFPTGL